MHLFSETILIILVTTYHARAYFTRTSPSLMSVINLHPKSYLQPIVLKGLLSQDDVLLQSLENSDQARHSYRYHHKVESLDQSGQPDPKTEKIVRRTKNLGELLHLIFGDDEDDEDKDELEQLDRKDLLGMFLCAP